MTPSLRAFVASALLAFPTALSAQDATPTQRPVAPQSEAAPAVRPDAPVTVRASAASALPKGQRKSPGVRPDAQAKPGALTIQARAAALGIHPKALEGRLRRASAAAPAAAKLRKAPAALGAPGRARSVGPAGAPPARAAAPAPAKPQGASRAPAAPSASGRGGRR